MRIIRQKQGAQLKVGRIVISTIRARPGATHGVSDVLAAATVLTAPATLALLGFAGGGIVAPLRRLGFEGRIDAVDISREGLELFEEYCRPWAGDVRFTQADAVGWLRRQTRPFDLIIEDLSVEIGGDITKPDVSLQEIPALMRSMLTPEGWAVINVLPIPGLSMTRTLARLRAPFPTSFVVSMEEYENRVVLAGRRSVSARWVSVRLREALRAIGSRQSTKIAVRRLPRPQ